jgi:hypothetical protein
MEDLIKRFWQGVHADNQDERDAFYDSISESEAKARFCVKDEEGDSYTVRLEETPWLGNRAKRIIDTVFPVS